MKHWEYHPEPVETCFGCKGLSIQMNAGDADSRRVRPRKKFESELDAYKEARAQGINPSGTTMEKIQAAKEASEKLGRAYNSETMPNAKNITKSTAKVINELGV